jgi:RNA polymerase sigma-70 factor, ECF subfamily
MPATQVALMQQLHDEHAAALWGYCLRLAGQDRARAEDLVQETMLRAWQHLSVLDDTSGHVRAWLFTVARNLVVDQWRAHRAHAELAMADVPEIAELGDSTDDLLLTWMVAEALAKLTPDHRAVLLACYYQGQSVAQAAQHLGVPPGTVKSRTHYALRALRLALEEMGVGA